MQVDSYFHHIRHIVLSSFEVSTIAGQTGVSGSMNGVGTNARLASPFGIALDATGTFAVVVSMIQIGCRYIHSWIMYLDSYRVSIHGLRLTKTSETVTNLQRYCSKAVFSCISLQRVILNFYLYVFRLIHLATSYAPWFSHFQVRRRHPPPLSL